MVPLRVLGTRLAVSGPAAGCAGFSALCTAEARSRGLGFAKVERSVSESLEKGDVLGCGFASQGELHGGEPIGPDVHVVDPLVDHAGAVSIP